MRSIVDFACNGVDDKNAIKVDRNTVTFIPNTDICFKKEHFDPDNPFVDLWVDADGKSMSGRSVTAGKKTTLTYVGKIRPEGWD